MNTLLSRKLLFMVALTLIGYSQPVIAQTPGFQSADPIRKNEQFSVTFHRPTLVAGSVSWTNGADTVEAGPPLSPEEIEKGFRVGEFIAVRIKAPIACYVYGVNNSQWDGVTLVENGEKLQANIPRDFVYKLSNRQGKQGLGNENIVFLIRTQPIPPDEVAKFLQGSTPSSSQPPSSGVPGSPSTAPSSNQPVNATPNQLRIDASPAELQAQLQSLKQKGSSKSGGIIKITCGVASFFFPFVRNLCDAGKALGVKGFSAADPVRRGTLQPDETAENIVVQFSFPLRP